jgi:hypothetical protein
MSLDNSIRALSYAEAPTLGTAIALIAKHRMDLDAALRAAETQQAPVTSEGAAEVRALDRMTAAAELHVLDKTA